MIDRGHFTCAVHGPIDERVTPGGSGASRTCPVMVRRTVGEFDEYAACGEPLETQRERAS
jgi:hypothetical protein